MIDLHSHILPALDDGAADREEALDLLRQYQGQKITDVVCTPHIEAEHLAAPARLAERRRRQENALADLRDLAVRAGSSINFHSGGEFVLTPDLPRQLAGMDKPGLAGSDYLLVELPPSFAGGIRLLENLLFEIQMAGFMPILAHPERAMHSAGVAAVFTDWVRQERLLLQVNAGSLVSLPDWPRDRQARFEKRLAHVHYLLAAKLVFCVASDAHNARLRPVLMDRAWQDAALIAGEAYAHNLFVSNPQAVLENIPLETVWQGEGAFI